MDLFIYSPPYQLWICTHCRYAVSPQTLMAHLRNAHRYHYSTRTPAQCQALLTQMCQRPWLNPSREPLIIPDPQSPPVPGLPVYRGYGCPHCAYIARAPKVMRDHRVKYHADQDGSCGRGRQPVALARARAQHRLADRVVHCQRFFRTGIGSSFFVVTLVAAPVPVGGAGASNPAPGTTTAPLPPASMTAAEFARAQVTQALQVAQNTADIQDGQVPEAKHPTEVSPWLELTRWPEYLRGHDLAAIALLGSVPDLTTEPLLAVFAASVARLIDCAYCTIRDHRINEFDQIQINTFFRRPSVWNRPIQIHLRPATFHRYSQVWQRLICFAYRSTRPDQATPMLRHQLTTAQLAALDMMEESGRRWLQQGGDCQGTGHTETKRQDISPIVPNSAGAAQTQAQLDEACLDLSIALLDHTLKGDLFESTLVGFLAVLGIDPECRSFRDPYGYTGYLSGLVKIAQMLVAEQAVRMAEKGQVSHPADALDGMRERFLLYGVRAPFGWITRLRTYGKKIQNTTTSLGYIYWSDDEQTLSYKDLQLSMTGFRQFISTQVELAQAELEQLFLLHKEEVREEVIPALALHELQDDPTKNQRGWNFLRDPRNRRILVTTPEDDLQVDQPWLLDRVLRLDWLREEFMAVKTVGGERQMLWREGMVDQYLQQVDQFLQRLLLLIHITGGQPGRATELLSLRHSNTVHGRHRNIFIEHGLVSTVTTYHKGYSISNSTKIIHRYLPKAVSELVVYYLWLILPFCQSLQTLVRGHKGAFSAFLWPAGDGSWSSDQLRKVLQREAQTYLQTKLNILSYRHAAIAISRVHLKCGGFKRDYGSDDGAAFNEQASHGSWIAGTVYARGLQEAPGHVEARRRQYRAISREWHGFLGFETSLGPCKRTWEESDQERRAKRHQPYIMISMDSN